MGEPPDPATACERTMRARVREVCARFEAEKGRLTWPGPRDPLAGLVRTLLSHNTTDVNAFAAYDRMRERYPDWEDVQHAPHDELAGTIRIAGLHNQKAERIQALLAFANREYGAYTADALAEMEFDDALETFGHLKGVKHKTLAVVLCFDLGRDLFPVDTHVHRVSRRLGFVPENATAVSTFARMNVLAPAGKSYQFHKHLIAHGRDTCHARSPKCGRCFVRDLCRAYRTGAV
ncbi:MAG: Ultraviolet N-glycosylase/AP lyase [Calditrichaeota bacterium]|nr:Ultraviolet N-glycosylase/AP lyase [Calditrichota bacterium]